MLRRLFVLLGATLALAALTGCAPSPGATPSPAASTQSVTDACAQVRAKVSDAATQLKNLDPADPAAAVDTFTQVAAGLGEASAAVGNADVEAALPGMQAGFSAAAQALQAIAGGDLSQVPALTQATGDIQASLSAFAELCGAP